MKKLPHLYFLYNHLVELLYTHMRKLIHFFISSPLHFQDHCRIHIEDCTQHFLAYQSFSLSWGRLDGDSLSLSWNSHFSAFPALIYCLDYLCLGLSRFTYSPSLVTLKLQNMHQILGYVSQLHFWTRFKMQSPSWLTLLWIFGSS